MVQLLKKIDKKKIKKLMRNKDFVFTISVYPTAFVIYLAFLIYIKTKTFEDNNIVYTIASFIILAFMTIITIFERVERRTMYKGQGDKLRLKTNDNDWKK